MLTLGVAAVPMLRLGVVSVQLLPPGVVIFQLPNPERNREVKMVSSFTNSLNGSFAAASGSNS